MNLKKLGLLLFFLLCLLPVNKIYAQLTNAGFVPSNIWYSKDPFEDGDKIKIYTLIFNPDTKELSGTVVFYDKTVLLGKKTFTVPAKGVKDVSIDWTVSAGEHTIFATLENAKFLISTGKYEDVTITENKTEESTNTISKKIVPVINTPIKKVSGTNNDIENTIIENTPDFLSKPTVLVAGGIESIRQNTAEASTIKKDEIGTELKKLDKLASDKKTSANKLLKPWTYTKYFFMSVFAFVLNNKFIFYIILAILTFLLLRYIWRKIF